jgi:hypothetical protein
MTLRPSRIIPESFSAADAVATTISITRNMEAQMVLSDTTPTTDPDVEAETSMGLEVDADAAVVAVAVEDAVAVEVARRADTGH